MIESGNKKRVYPCWGETMKKNKAVLTYFIKDDQVDLNQYLTYLFQQFKMSSQGRLKKCKIKKIN